MPIPSMPPKPKHSESIGRLLEGKIYIVFYITSDQICSASYDGNMVTAGEDDFDVVLD